MSDSKKTSVSGNYILNTLVSVLGLIAPLITTPYISRVLGAEAIGIFNYCYSIEIYFAVMGQLGIPLYAKREIAKVKENKGDLNKKYSELIFLQFISVSFALIIYLIAMQFFNADYKIMFLVCGIEMIANLFNISWLFVGMEDFKSIAKRDIIFRILSIAFIFLFVKKPDDLYIYALCLTMSNLICSSLLFIKAFKIVKFVKVPIKDIFKNLKPTFIMMLPGMVTIIYAVIDETMLGTIGGDMAQVGIYEQTQKIVKVALVFLTSLGVILLPRLSSLFSKKEYSEYKNLVTKSLSFMCFLSIPLAFGCFAISDDLVPWFYGEGFNDIKNLLKIFAPMFIFMGISDLMGAQVFVSTNRENKLLVINIISVVINFALNALLIPNYLAMGAVIATVVSEFIKCLISLIMSRKLINWKIFIIDIFKYSIISFIMFAVVYLLKINLPINSTFISTLILIIVGGISYVFILLITKDKWLFRGIDMIKSFLRKFTKKQSNI